MSRAIQLQPLLLLMLNSHSFKPKWGGGGGSKSDCIVLCVAFIVETQLEIKTIDVHHHSRSREPRSA